MVAMFPPMPSELRTADFEIDIPPELIAARPAAVRDQSRLLVARRDPQSIEHQPVYRLCWTICGAGTCWS